MDQRLESAEMAHAFNVQPDDMQRMAILQVLDEAIEAAATQCELMENIVDHPRIAYHLGSLTELESFKTTLLGLYDMAPHILEELAGTDDDEDESLPHPKTY